MMWWHRLPRIKKVYVTYSAAVDLDDVAGNQVTQFTVGDERSSTVNAATDGITGASVDANEGDHADL